MGSHYDAPAPRNYGAETQATLAAQVKMMPEILAAEQKYRPGFTALDLQTADQAINGTGGQPGLADLWAQLSPKIDAIQAASNSRSRAADIADVAKLGPQAMAALRSANPAQWSLLDTLNQQASADLSAGSSLTPDMQREIEQYVRQGQSARGLSAGPAEVYTEAVTKGQAGMNLLNQRRQFAAGMVGLNQQIAGDPFLQTVGRSSGTGYSGAAGGVGAGQGLAKSIGPNLVNPESQYAADINNQNYQGELSAAQASAANSMGLIGGLLNFGGKIGAPIVSKYI